MRRAVVLAGGGVAGIAWELGVLRGIQDADAELASSLIAADVIVGTSAGSAVAAQITSGTLLEDLYAAQLSQASSELEVDLDLAELMTRFATATAGATTAQDMRRRIGALALATETVSESARRAAIAARLPARAWPDRALLLTAVDAQTGDPVTFTPGDRGRPDRRRRRQLRRAGRLATGHHCRAALHRRRHALGHQCRPGGRL